MLATFLSNAHAPEHAPEHAPAHAYLPTIPSPLSPRSANIYGPQRRGAYMSSKQGQPHEEKDATQKKAVPYSKRAVKKAPSPTHDELKERRRDIFLRRVRDGREEKRFEARGEDMMRLTFLQQRRQWEAEQARSAPSIPLPASDDEYEDEDLDLSAPSQPATQHSAQEEINAILLHEDAELQALLEYMPDDDEQMGKEDDTMQHEGGWSDEEDYDALFADLIAAQEGGGPVGEGLDGKMVVERKGEADGEAMDLS